MTTDQRRVDGLREAADTVPSVVSPAELGEPIRAMFLAAAERIEAAGSSLGLPVNYELWAASVILGTDLGHNR